MSRKCIHRENSDSALDTPFLLPDYYDGAKRVIWCGFAWKHCTFAVSPPAPKTEESECVSVRACVGSGGLHEAPCHGGPCWPLVECMWSNGSQALLTGGSRIDEIDFIVEFPLKIVLWARQDKKVTSQKSKEPVAMFSLLGIPHAVQIWSLLSPQKNGKIWPFQVCWTRNLLRCDELQASLNTTTTAQRIYLITISMSLEAGHTEAKSCDSASDNARFHGKSSIKWCKIAKNSTPRNRSAGCNLNR